MKCKVLACGLVLILIAGLITGCGKQETVYALEEKDTEESETVGGISLEQYKGMENWTDRWTVVDASGQEQMISINAEVNVPDAEGMSVVEVERTVTDGAFREQFLREFFEGGEVYYADEEDDTTAEIGRTLAEDFASCAEYEGYKGEVLYNVSFGETEIIAKAASGEFAGPEALREYEFVEQVSEYSTKAGEPTENECRYSRDAAKTLAQDFMRAIGRSNQICMEEKPVMWHGQNKNENMETTGEEYILCGYIFVYGTGIEDVAFAEFPDRWDYDITRADGDETMDVANMCNGDRIEIMITNDGVASVKMLAPVTISVATGPVEALALDTIKDIMENELAENGEKYDFAKNKRFNRIRLIYLKVKDEAEEGKYSYIPVWCLSDTDQNELHHHPIFVNAMDGNIIYIK